jgi:hypothetical protein
MVLVTVGPGVVIARLRLDDCARDRRDATGRPPEPAHPARATAASTAALIMAMVIFIS